MDREAWRAAARGVTESGRRARDSDVRMAALTPAFGGYTARASVLR